MTHGCLYMNYNLAVPSPDGTRVIYNIIYINMREDFDNNTYFAFIQDNFYRIGFNLMWEYITEMGRGL